jgi:O-acetyl-ADP-ribose deacetylase (regulator of RNase III)
MKIIYRHADATQAPERLLLHGANSRGVMRSGIADTIRSKWPTTYMIYHKVWQYVVGEGGEHLPLGEVIWTVERRDGSNDSPIYHWRFHTQPDTIIIANCITQKDYGRDSRRVYVDYEAVALCFAKVNALAIIHNIPVIAMPRVGCGLAHGSWERVEPLIREFITVPDVVIYDWPDPVPGTPYE